VRPPLSSPSLERAGTLTPLAAPQQPRAPVRVQRAEPDRDPERLRLAVPPLRQRAQLAPGLGALAQARLALLRPPLVFIAQARRARRPVHRVRMGPARGGPVAPVRVPVRAVRAPDARAQGRKGRVLGRALAEVHRRLCRVRLELDGRARRDHEAVRARSSSFVLSLSSLFCPSPPLLSPFFVVCYTSTEPGRRADPASPPAATAASSRWASSASSAPTPRRPCPPSPGPPRPRARAQA